MTLSENGAEALDVNAEQGEAAVPGSIASPRLHKRISPVILQLFRFGISTGISASITLGGPILLHELFGVREQAAVATAFCVAFVVNFLVNRYFVFGASESATRDLIRYAVANLSFRVLEYLTFTLLFQMLGFHYIAAVITVLTISTIAKFVVYKMIVFLKPEAA